MRIKSKKGWIARDFVIAGLLFSAILGAFLGFFIILISTFDFKFNEIAGIFMIDASIIAVSIIIVAVLKR